MSTTKFAKQVSKYFDAARKAIDTAEEEALKALSANEEAEEEEVDDEEEAPESEARILYWDGDDESNLDEMELKELKALAKELEFKLSAKAMKDAELAREEIFEAFAPDEEEGEEEEEQEEEDGDEDEVSTVVTVLDADGEEEQIDLAELNVTQLKKFAKDYELEVTTKSKPDLIQEIIDQMYAEAGEEEEEEEQDEEEAEEEDFNPEEAYGLSDMSQEELAELLAEHGLSVKGKRQALVDRIIKAIEDGTIEVEEEEGE